MALAFPHDAEWLEADGLGGFASGTVDDIRTRRYHALLLCDAGTRSAPGTSAPPGRHLLVNGVEAWLEAGEQRFALTSQRYAPGVVAGDGASRIVEFEPEPWPQWTLELARGVLAMHERFVSHGEPLVVLRWRVTGTAPGARLHVRPLLSGRDPHTLHHANGAFRFEARRFDTAIGWRPYSSVPGVLALSDAEYDHAPDWYWRFLYEEERRRGLDCEEDLASPGVFRWTLARREAVLILAADTPAMRERLRDQAPRELAKRLAQAERQRRSALGRVPPASPNTRRAADAYIVRRGERRTIIAGYPWFVDWGRDTFIALRGLCLATGRLDDARAILLEWASEVSQGMLPNRFPDAGGSPEYNSVDASLWYCVVVGEWLEAMRAGGRRVAPPDRARLREAVEAILAGYATGTRFGIRADADGLLAAGEPGVQLTWMDAKVGDWVVTPRTGKPVEVQALWVNALDVGARFATTWGRYRDLARAAFEPRFWNESRGCLYDVVDVDHVPGRVDASLRPNQLFAVGGLPLPLVEGERARRIVELAERTLLTPLGPRSLAPGEPGYAAHYRGDARERDGAYHQGTVWPWLIGAFVEAWLNVHGVTLASRREAAERFLSPLRAHLGEAGLGHVSEIADAEPPHLPAGCPFQAWSLGELLRMERRVGLARAGRRGREAATNR